MGEQMELLQGTLDLLILKALALEPMHGWAISQRLRQISDGVLSVQQGSLYPALQRLELRGWITSEWRLTQGTRRARFYSLSRAGRRRLENKCADWQRFTAAVQQVLRTT
jgi:PadR family transcriptional regulator, regulatory protein PadR